MKICPYCMYELIKESKSCPSCSYEEGSDDLVLHNKTWKAVVVFGVVALFLVGGIIFFDRVILGGGLKLTSNCGGDENCLVTGLAVCNIGTGEPQSYGVTNVNIRGEQNNMCIVDVKVIENDNLRSGAVTKEKRCAFAMNQLGGLETKDLYLCQDNIDAGVAHDMSVIQGAFLPVEQQLK